MEGKKYRPGKTKVKKKVHTRARGTLSGPGTMEEKKLAAAAINSLGVKEKHEEKCDSQEVETRQTSDKYPLALQCKVFGCNTEKWDLG